MVLRPIFYILGWLLLFLGASMIFPILVAIGTGSYDWWGFVEGGGITFFFGGMMTLANRYSLDQVSLGVREAFLLTALSWIFTIFFASLPFLLSAHPQTFTNSLFEATSALTTTGMTIMNSLSNVTPGILLWRALLQWFGGIGIIVMALTVLPILRIGGMQLFRSEVSEKVERNLPRVSQTAKSIFFIQTGVMVVVVLGLLAVGLSPLDAVCHGMAALSTGGLSTLDASIQGFANPKAEVILIFAMLVGSLALPTFSKLFQGQWRSVLFHPQTSFFFKIILIITGAVFLWRMSHEIQADLMTIFRETFFMVVSSISSTGFVVGDVRNWGNFVVLLLFTTTFIGGCTGSTTGGIKVFRLQVLWTVLKTQMAQLRRPHGVFLPHYHGQVLSEGVIRSVFTFFALFGVTFGLTALGLGVMGLSPLESLSASAAAVTNGGASLIASEGGALTSTGSKCILMLGMLLGRLEMMTLVALLLPAFWRK